MQPHSMVMVGLTSYVWNSYKELTASSCKAKVDYINRDGNSKTLYYDVYDISLSKDTTELTAYVVRTSGGLACKMKARRGATSEGAEVSINHGTIHASGVYERYNLYKTAITNGKSEKSTYYGTFSGEIEKHRPNELTLKCELFKPTRSIESRYELEMSGF